MSIEVTFTLNGASRTVHVRDDESLLDTLRERLGVRSVKNGCAPQGQCGCCLALIDGKAKVTCATPTARVGGKDVLTLEGVSAREREVLASAFAAATGLQCGFCTPGLALRAKHLLDRDPSPSREAIAKAIDGHLCRCTGYVRVIDAIELAARGWRGEPAPVLAYTGGVGDAVVKRDAAAMTLGDRAFVEDLVVPGMLHGAVVLSEHARARVVRIDTDAARAMPGVRAVLTAADVPGRRWYGLLVEDWPGLVAEGEEVRCVGDVLAVVAADDLHTARAAAAAVRVEVEVLDAVTDRFAALLDSAPQVNPTGPNLLSHTRFSRGDVDAALAASAHVVRETFQTQRIEHLFLEPECALAVPREDGVLHLYTQGQGVFDDQKQVAAFLGEPREQVFVELVPTGGAFGGKEDLSIQAHAALLARATGCPVRLALTREQSIRLHPKRHALHMTYEVGCDAEGRLTAVRARIVGDTGAYASVGAKVLERAAGHACGPYRVASGAVEALAVRTNNPPCGAMRGFGANQVSFAIEGCMDRLAEEVGLDRWEIRWRNAVEVGDALITGQVLTKSVGIKPTLLAVRDRFRALEAAGRAVGIGCGIKNSGLGNGAVEWGRARLVVDGPDTVTIYIAFTEMGQGLFNVAVQCASEVTGLAATVFTPRVDATFALGSGQTTGSRATLLTGRAVVEAATRLREALDGGASLADLRGEVFAGDVRIDDTSPPDAANPAPKVHTTYGFATQLCALDDSGRVAEFVAAHDVGRAINPALCRGQIEGAVHMGLGFALTEELPCDDGMPVATSLRELGVLRARDMPEVEVLLIEESEPEGPFGAKGVGEIGLVPTAGAVAGALRAFDGVWRTVLPMKDSAAARAISVGTIRAPRSEAWR